MNFGKLKLTEVDKQLLECAAFAGMKYATINRIYPIADDEEVAASNINAEVVGLGFTASDLTKVTHQYKQHFNNGEWLGEDE